MTDWMLNKAERGVLLGRTGTGKSTLATELLRQFQANYPKGRILVIDSKPRYRATMDRAGNGLRYKGWVDGDTLADSVAIHAAGDLKGAFRWGRVAILQSMTPHSDPVPDYTLEAARAASILFQESRKDKPTLLYIDEMYDLSTSTLASVVDARFLQTIRAGRERNMAVLSAAQRPRSIPVPVLTEAGKFYIFELSFSEDIDYLSKHVGKVGGQPTEGGAKRKTLTLDLEPEDHQFAFYKLTKPREKQLMRLEL